ncbi:MAG: family 43 glycosylhydrolase, partial [Clostridia bacterium]|nr:family 43 glycosylhydrolase [Clostridia bacterium]
MKTVISKKNPIIPRMGVCDPHMHVFEGKVWLYTSHDTSIENTTFCMNDWQIWSSADCVEWHREATIRPEDTFVGATDKSWAVDCAERNGKYYYSFSIGTKQTGVLVGDSP